MESNNKEYFAFISYQRKDEEWAKQLLSKLEHYRLPSKIRKENASLPKEIRPIFRDTQELASGVLAKEIEKALQESKFLIVICSPNSAKSLWVNEEIKTFISLGREERIIPFIIDGIPYSEDETTECFPPALRSLKGDRNKELHAINISDINRDAAYIKVIARMFGLKFNTLWDRYEREQKKRRYLYLMVALTIIGVAFGMYFWTYLKNQELERSNWKTKENEARYIAVRGNQLVDEDDALTARFILSKVLPTNLENPNYPYTTEAEAALRKAWGSRSFILNGHTRNLWTSVFSPDGKKIVTASSDNTVRVWDVASGMQLLVLTGHEDAVCFATFSPNGNDIASLSWDNVIKIWDASTGELKNSFTGNRNNTHTLSYSPDGNRIAVGYSDGNIIIRDSKSGHIINSFKGHEGRVWSVCYSHDGKHLVSSSNDGFVKTWDTGSWKEVRAYKDIIRYAPYSPNAKISPFDYKPESTDIWQASYSPDDTRIIYVSDSAIIVLDAQSGMEKLRIKGHTGDVTKAKFNHDGKRIVSSSRDNTIKIWDAKTGELIKTLSGHKGTVRDVNFSPDDKMIASGSDDNSARLWDLGGNEPSIIIKSNMRPITYFAFGGRTFPKYDHVGFAMFTPDGKSIVFTTEERGIKTYNLENGNIEIKDTANYYGKLETGMFSPDGKYLVRSSGDKIRILDAQTLHVKKELKSELYTDNVYFINNGENIISLTRGGYELWDWNNDNCLKNSSFDSTYYATIVSSQGYIATSRQDTLAIWNVKTGKKEKTLINDHHEIEKIVFSPNGKYLACTSNNVTADIWDIYTGKKVQTIYGYSNFINTVSFNPQETVLMTGGREGLVKIWDIKTGNLLSEYEGDAGSAYYASFSPSGEKIVVGYEKEVIKIWDFPLLQNLINRTNLLFRDRKLTQEEKDKFHLE